MVVTGRNNVGKTRLLLSLFGASTGAIPLSGGEGCELEIREGEGFQRWWVNDQQLVEYVDTLGGVEHHGLLRSQPNGQYVFLLDGQNQVFGGRPTYQQLQGPGQVQLSSTLSRLARIDAQRTVNPEVLTEPADVPDSTGDNLGRVIFTHLSNATSEFQELQETMRSLFPEIGTILTVPVGNNRVRLSIADRFSERRIPLSECGTGVNQALHLVASVLMHPVGRIFTVDEPHVFLHAGAERQLARFIRDQAEHRYVVATHSPVFINAVDPDTIWLVTRDRGGSQYRTVLPEALRRVHYTDELGVNAADVALHEALLFVEGDSDVTILDVLLLRMGWDLAHHNVALLDLHGGDVNPRMHSVLQNMRASIGIPVWVLLDGDKAQWANGDWIRTLPVREVEGLFIGDARAVRQVLVDVCAEEDQAVAGEIGANWPESRVQEFLAAQPSKPSKALADLAHAMGTQYRKRVHGPLLAAAVDINQLLGTREILAAWLGAPGDVVPYLAPD